MTSRTETVANADQRDAALAPLHVCRTPSALAKVAAAWLERALPDAAFAICANDPSGGAVAEAVSGNGCPWQKGQQVAAEDWHPDGGSRHAILVNEDQIGELVVSRSLSAEEDEQIAAFLEHYSAASVNLALGVESQQTAESYCASLQALEEAVVLFQEEDPCVVHARLLSLASSLLHASAAALYVLREVGDIESGLELASALGIPETVVDGLRAADGGPWAERLTGRQVAFLTRDESGALAGLAPESTLEVLQNVVVLPLRYHGVEAGVCVLFNAAIDERRAEDHLRRVQSLGQLGAALMHRFQLESIAVQNRALAKELQIAETIQRQLLPAEAPNVPGCEFAWSSVAAAYIGGDYLDVIPAARGAALGVVADVSGHGVNSALLMSSFRSTYRAECRRMRIDALATGLSSEVGLEVGDTGMFITAAMFRIAPGGRRLTITSAGHNPVMIYRAESRSVDTVEAFGPPLGLFPGAEYGHVELELREGDVVLLYTDGVTEAMAAGGDEMFSEERLERLLIDVAGESAAAIVKIIRDSLVEFTGSDQFEDDVSILVSKATPVAG